MVAICTQVDFGVLLEHVLENEAMQMAEPASGMDAAALLQDFSSLGVFSMAVPLLSTPTHEAPPFPADANASGAAGTHEMMEALGRKKKKGPQKGKQGQINRAAHKSVFCCKKRAEERKVCTPFKFKLKVRMVQRHGAPEPIHVDCRASEFCVNHNTYTAWPQAKIGKVPFSLEDLEKSGLKIVPWDEKIPMSALNIIETEMGYFVGQPQAPDWNLAKARRASGAILSHSGPQYHENKPKEQEIIDRLLTTPSIQCIATFGSRSLAYCAPKVYQHYTENLKPIYDDYGLKLLFQDSIFPSANFNLGPKTACRIHVDCQNCPYGFCTITVLGNYDPKKGSHLILWDFGFAIKFPPSSTILIPSACVQHGNVAIQLGEKRNCNVGELTPEEVLEIDGPKGTHHKKCQKLFSKYNQLADDQQEVWGSQ
ncbi:hypothetical protein EWM64_g4261 [Hericium alpestre]|uniref:Uncharacterized protein n=1 Tax=Hericium alpestre TaxID=135208 RepID=A0A4Z0A1N5_9AGAM|nr:hypothetical protein EWM64_g4261 [Hericium alpestre]